MTALITVGVGTVAALLLRRQHGLSRDEYEDLMEELAETSEKRRSLETNIYELQQLIQSLDQQGGKVRRKQKVGSRAVLYISRYSRFISPPPCCARA